MSHTAVPPPPPLQKFFPFPPPPLLSCFFQKSVLVVHRVKLTACTPLPVIWPAPGRKKKRANTFREKRATALLDISPSLSLAGGAAWWRHNPSRLLRLPGDDHYQRRFMAVPATISTLQGSLLRFFSTTAPHPSKCVCPRCGKGRHHGIKTASRLF